MIYRVDENHMEVFESDDLKKVTTMYNGLGKEWIDSTAEKRPFRLPAPALHSMLPSFISEIKVESMSKEEYQQSQNPYSQQMQTDGLSTMMNRNFNNS